MRLYFVNGDRSGQFWELVPPGICIGREEDNDIQLLLPGISRYHAKIEYTGSRWRITDLGSTNGTKVDGKSISGSVLLRNGIQISIGEQLIRFEEEIPREQQTESKELKPDQNSPVISLPPPPQNGGKSSPAPIKSEPEIPRPAEEGKNPETAEKSDSKIRNKFNVDDLFRKKSDPFEAGKDPGNSKTQSPAKRISNLLFILLVVVLGCAVIFVFMALNAPAQKRSSRKGLFIQNPFILEYEKKLVKADNVFRFYVRIEENSVLFKLDDLQSRRHFTKGIGQVEKEQLQTLLKEIKNTDFMKNTSEPAGKGGNDEDDYRKLTVGYDNQFNSVVCHNVSPSNSFTDIENALESFADGFGLKTINLSVEQMRKEAEQSFIKAEDLYHNYQARPENLRNAIIRYQITIDFLEQFDPKPESWNKAKKQLAKAQKLLHKLIKDCEYNFDVFYRRKEYTEAIKQCNLLLMYLDSEDRRHQRVRQIKIALQKRISNQGKRRRR